MKTIIYYYSKTGHSKDYASSLSNRIDCSFYSYKEIKVKVMRENDTIIFIAPVHGNRISHLDKFLKHYEKIKDKNIIIVAVGMQPSTPERRETIILTNALNYYHVRLYELTGGFNIEKLSWPMQKAMKVGLKVAMKKDPNLKMMSAQIENIFRYPVEYNDINGIEKILDTIHRLERESKVI